MKFRTKNLINNIMVIASIALSNSERMNDLAKNCIHAKEIRKMLI